MSGWGGWGKGLDGAGVEREGYGALGLGSAAAGGEGEECERVGAMNAWGGASLREGGVG